MKISVAQTKPIKGNIQKNIENHIRIIKLAVSEEADVIIFPELSLTGYEPELAQKLAVEKDDVRFDNLQKISSVDQIIIGVGVPIKNGSEVSISMLIFHPDKERQVYYKQYLHASEDKFFSSRNNLNNLIYGESIALAICYELSVPMHSERAFKRGAAFYIASVVESVEYVDKSIDKLAKIAKKYAMTVFMSNCIGKTGRYNAAGKTSIWDKKGELLIQLNTNEEGIVILDTTSNKTFLKYL
ncbi:carbon-nitrogen hydrolase family protein [Lutibacter sp.]|uniref:carbon-nitrogen hydrolase family protein n=1 Tax=Lutibacter sp. TaxID=1925666 RepID=UPI0025BCEF74|nr:carbon-nitrogen hydrolase family protein [Lutibacter sp.]MCF6169174.1 carbon-nitrogen hydrolase family protein [Lutibacter sp.]